MEHSNFSSDRMDWETLKGFILSPDGFPVLIKAEDIQLITTRHHKLVSAKDLEGIFPIRSLRDKDGSNSSYE